MTDSRLKPRETLWQRFVHAVAPIIRGLGESPSKLIQAAAES